MTLKKSLISISAAAVIAATITGCGSSSSTNTDPSGISDGPNLLDGYIYNATGKAYYLAEDNTTMTAIALTAAKTTKDVVTGVVTLGESTYKLPTDINASTKARIKFFQFVTTASSTDGTTFTPAAYIESDNVDGYDSNDTLMGSTVITVPANADIASPLTQLIYQNSSAALFGTTTTAPTTTGDLNTTTFTNLEANATAIAAKLGLGSVDLFTADPIALAANNPTLRLVTALLLNAPSTAVSTILASTTAATLDATLTIIAASTTGSASALATSLAASAKNGAFTTSDIAGMNIEASVAAGTVKTLVAPTLTGKLPLNAITFGTTDAATLTASGAKLANTSLSLDLNMSNVDGNISNKMFTLYVTVAGNKANVAASDANNSGAVNFSLPFELNATNSVIAPTVSAASIINLEAKSSDGSQVITKSDLNASTVTGAITVSSNVVSININTVLDAVVTKADANLTGVTGLTTDGIADIKIYVKDTNGALIGVTADGLNSLPLAKGSYSSLTGGITATSVLKGYDNTVTDYRNTSTTSINNVPTVTGIVPTANTDMNSTADSNATVGTTDLIDATVAITKDAGTTNLLLAITSGGDANEANNTVTVTETPAVSWITPVASSVVGTTLATAVDFNLTIDGNASITTETSTVLTFSSKDEFGKASTADKNVTVLFNLAPALASGKVLTAINDVNSTGIAYNGYFTNLNGEDSQSTAVYLDSNASADGNLTGVLTSDGNLTLSVATGDTNQTVWYTFRVTDAFGAYSDFNVTLVNDDQ